LLLAARECDGYREVVLVAEDILGLRNAAPFKPFRLHLSDGRTFVVENPDTLWVFRNRVNLAFPAEPGHALDREEKIAMVHIVRVEELS